VRILWHEDVAVRHHTRGRYCIIVDFGGGEPLKRTLRRFSTLFPSIGAARGIGMAGAATTISIVYVLEKNEELCRDWLGFSPYMPNDQATNFHLYFSKVDSCKHMFVDAEGA
jgi:hypothetical protein